ncbi:MAG: 1-acyl-sn-glycerol-3-phosphate acyltransferase [Desulfobaccales bacterium]
MKLDNWRRWGVILALAILLILSLISARRLHLDERLTSMLPDSDPIFNRYLFVAQRFHVLDAVYVDIESESAKPADQQDAESVADALYERLHRSGMFAHIFYKVSGEQFGNLVTLLSSRKARLADAADLVRYNSRFKDEEVYRLLAAAKRRLLEPAGVFWRGQVSRDPLNLDDLVLQKLEILRADAAGTQMIGGRLWNEDGKHILIIALPDFPAVDTKRGEKLVDLLHQARREAVEVSAKSRVEISFTGSHISTLDNSLTIKGDVTRAMISMSLGLLLLGVLVFRSRLFVLIIFLPAAFGLTMAAGVMALWDPFFSAIALGCGSVLVGIAVDYGVPILYHLDNLETGRTKRKRVIRSLVFPLVMGAATTIAGFAGLTFMSLPGQRQMGWFAGLGIIGAMLFAILGLQYFIPDRPGKASRPVVPLDAFCSRLREWIADYRVWTLIVGFSLLALSAYGISRLQFEGDVSRLSHLNPQNQRDSEKILKVWGSFSPTMAVVRGGNLEEALEANDRVFDVLKELMADGKIVRFGSISPILPALKVQEKNLQRWKEFWSVARRNALRSSLDKGAAAQGFKLKIFAPFFDGLYQEPPPVTLKDFESTPLKYLMASKVVTDGTENLVMSSFFLGDRSRLAEVEARIAAAVPGAIVVDKKSFVEYMGTLVKGEFHKLLLIALAAITLCLYLFLRRVELVVVNLLPVIASVVVTMGLMGFWGVRINLMSLLFVVFIFGVGVDFSIFLMSSALNHYRGKGGNEFLMGGAVIICALTTAGGFFSLIFSRHSMLFSMGLTGLISMLTSVAAALVIVPSYMNLLLWQEGRHGTPSLKTMAGTAWAAVYLVGAAFLYSYCLRYIMRLRYSTNLEARGKFCRRYLHLVAAGLLRSFPYLDSRRIYLGAEPESFARPAVIISNHQSAFDIMLLLALPVEMVMVVKKWVWKAPVIGPLIRDAGYLVADRESYMEILLQSRECLGKGISIIIFPEGSRSPDGRLKRFHVGAFKLALETEADVVPIMITNSQACIPYKAFWVGDHQTVVRVLPRVTREEFDYSRDARELSRHVKRMLQHYELQDWQLSQDGPAFWHNVRSLYNYRGSYVEGYISWKLRLDPIYKGIDDLVPQEGTVLDLGSGHGLMAAILARKSRHRHILGIDFDERKFKVSQGVALAFPNIEFHMENFLQWEYPPVDAVLLIDSLHYWPEGRQLEVIAKACQALREGGLIVFRDAFSTRSFGHLAVRMGEYFGVKVGHNRRGTGLYFQTKQFFLDAFANHGVKFLAEVPDLGRGSNIVLVFKKETGCATTLS